MFGNFALRVDAPNCATHIVETILYVDLTSPWGKSESASSAAQPQSRVKTFVSKQTFVVNAKYLSITEIKHLDLNFRCIKE